MAGEGSAASGVVAEARGCGDRLAEAAVEALDHAVGLRRVGPGQAVLDAVGGADAVEGMPAAGPAGPPGHVAAEAVGELGAVVGEDGVGRAAEGGDEARHRGGDALGGAVGDDLDPGEAGRPLDGDEDVLAPALELRQVPEVDMDVAEGRRLEGLRLLPPS